MRVASSVEMDICAHVAARRALIGTGCTDAVTVSGSASFHRPAFVGEIVHLEARVTDIGSKSITVIVEACREDKQGDIKTMAKGTFVFVSFKGDAPAEHGLKHGTNTV